MFTIKNKVCLLMVLLLSFAGYGQVGINNPSPSATLEITAKKTDGSRPEGIIPTRLPGDSLRKADQKGVYGRSQDGVITFVTAAASPVNRVGQTIDIDARGYYYYDFPANKWIKLYGSASASATVNTLTCTGAAVKGSLYSGTPASGVSVQIPYTGGNGGDYPAQTITSAGVTGLTAALPAGTLGSSGKLDFTVSGTPSGTGTASFALIFGGKTCTFTLTVNAAAVVTALNCTGATVTGGLYSGTPASEVSVQISYTGGNSASYPAQTISSTGVTGLTASLLSGSIGDAGNLTYTITGTPSDSGTASFAISFGGKSCTFTIKVNAVAAVSTLNCTGATVTGSLYNGFRASEVSVQIPYAGGNSVSYPAQTISSAGVTGLTAALPAGSMGAAGNLTYTITGTPSGTGTASFTISFGGKTCTFTMTVNTGAAVTQLSCTEGTRTGSLMHGVAASAVSFKIPYTGGNSASYPVQTIASTGITGLTATLNAGTIGASGKLEYTVSGTPEGTGSAKFMVGFGGKNCEFTMPVADNPDPVVNWLSCGSGTLTGTIIPGEVPAGVSFTIPYGGGNGKAYPAQSIFGSNGGPIGLTAFLAAGTLANGAGSVTYTISPRTNIAGNFKFVADLGGKTCEFRLNVPMKPPDLKITRLDCATATKTGTLTSGTAASGVSFTITYSVNGPAGQSGAYPAQSISSTGVTGLTASLPAGWGKAPHDQTITFTVSGTPSGTGTASFAFNFGGIDCTVGLTVN
ncbi:hypothetical protein ACR1PO_03240 [Chryseobacterium sp. RRHN12]|uniref:hypothetical protein n=1 Tax=Chryseobacterium sp. RRHN12 TaxID=3437884 RepID=UPI003D9B2A60